MRQPGLDSLGLLSYEPDHSSRLQIKLQTEISTGCMLAVKYPMEDTVWFLERELGCLKDLGPHRNVVSLAAEVRGPVASAESGTEPAAGGAGDSAGAVEAEGELLGLALEYCNNDDLDDYLRRGRYTLEDYWDLALQVRQAACVLSPSRYAHQLLRFQGSAERAKRGLDVLKLKKKTLESRVAE